MFLIDTNCFMQIIRNRPQALQVRSMLDGIVRSRLFVTDFAVHSIGVIMSRFKQIDGYVEFVNDLGIGASLKILRVDFQRLDLVADACKSFHLDFDDAYQYAAAELNSLELVSLDADFDRTPRGRLTPKAALERFTEEQKHQRQEP